MEWDRRKVVRGGVGWLLAAVCGIDVVAQPRSAPVTLRSIPIEMVGDWRATKPQSALQVVEPTRDACLQEVRLVSDQQPSRLRVDDHASGVPAVWLHPDNATMAWIIVDIGERDWSKLAYQFGHELGHVVA